MKPYIAAVVLLTAACSSPAHSTSVAQESAAGVHDAASRLVLLDEHFQRTLPDHPNGAAWFPGGGYELFVGRPGQFVAVRVPMARVPENVIVSGTFRKVGGPPGGGYGLVVRDQLQSAGDGADQTGQFLVAAVGDRGEVGVWQRAGRYWIDLLPWTPSAAVRTGTAANDLIVQLGGDLLTFIVNGVQVAALRVGLSDGQVGVFAGGDLNQVQLDHLVVEVARHGVDAPADTRGIDSGPREISDTATRLTRVSDAANQDPAVQSNSVWRQQIATSVATLRRLARAVFAGSGTRGQTTAHVQRLGALLSSIADDVASIVGAFSGGIDSPHSPMNDPSSLRDAAEHLDTASRNANQVLAEVQALRDQP